VGLTITTIVCAFNEEGFLPACLHSLRAQTRPPDEIIAINNASVDATGVVARQVFGVQVIDEPTKGLVTARETARRAAKGDVLAYVDADCRASLTWLERVERRFQRDDRLVAITAPYRFYDWDATGRVLIRIYDRASRLPLISSFTTCSPWARFCTEAISPYDATP
jgi:glycosyltransferase involved in cell wall biosynthesis